ncbi:alpha/beta hydrolase family protein [Membranihabitans marinus]|uniref:alpha/beta hydrolase family protein n=1 Tax=Membranihabitans marinus TaxID=1227546 RepID=UPI001F1E0882|nr:alpha/beta hydrolase family protein [Membranihabitans marinus]
MKENRRSFLKWTGLSSIGLTLPSSIVARPKNIDNSSSIDGGMALPTERSQRFSSMMQEYYVGLVKKKDKEHNQRIFGMSSKREALEYQSQIKKRWLDCLGPFPEKTELNPVITGQLNREGYRVEKVIFESRPGFKVTANFYVNEKTNGPSPTILGLCGHTREAKASGYEVFAQSLVRKGYNVLMIDPIGQGERLQYVDTDGESEFSYGVREHMYAGVPLVLTGASMSGFFVWDCIRAVDYLYTRAEVDKNHIGVTGNSGGGTQTALLCAVEDRLTMAAPSCYITTLRRNIENEEIQDTEQCPPKILGHDMDHFDMMAAMAPKPIMLISQEFDFFDTRGTAECFEKLKHFYNLLGASENVALFVGDGYHGYHLDGREAMYGFFNKITGVSNIDKEGDVDIEEDEDLWCTSNGQLSEAESKQVYDILKEKSIACAQQRKSLTGSGLNKAISEVLRLPMDIPLPDYRILRGRKEKKFPKLNVADYLLETETGINISVYRLSDNSLYSRPPQSPSKAILYVSHKSMDEELISDPFLKELVDQHPDHGFYSCDLRGIGQSFPNIIIPDKIFFKSEYQYANIGNMLNEPLVGKRTFDLLCVVNWLASHRHRDITVVARGWGSIPASFASLMTDKVNKLVLKNALTSFSSIAESKYYHWPLSSMPPAVLQYFDLPDCYAELKKTKQLEMMDMWDEMADKA